jgi:2-keto-3-deoxygluconate permease
VLLPIGIGMLLGNLDNDIREFLKPGEILPVPFFAFALGAGMNLANFFNPQVVGAGITLGIMTTVLTGGVGILVFKLFREKSYIAPVAEASTAGNAAGTPAAIAAAASIAAGTGMMSAADALAYKDLVNIATIQISIATLTTAILCPLAVIMVDRYQKRKGINAKAEVNEEVKLDMKYTASGTNS